MIHEPVNEAEIACAPESANEIVARVLAGSGHFACEVTMSYRDKTDGQAGVPSARTEWRSDARSLTEWEADTDVMPVEYCRLLMEISRQLK
jgi:hypothetical protein